MIALFACRELRKCVLRIPVAVFVRPRASGAGGVQKLHRLVGRGKALEWILLGSHVTAGEALAHGLVTAVHPAADLMPAALELAGRFRLLGPRAVAQSKMAVRLCGDADLASARDIGLEALTTLIDGPEWQEGMKAFMEKRDPRFPPLLPPQDGAKGH